MPIICFQFNSQAAATEPKRSRRQALSCLPDFIKVLEVKKACSWGFPGGAVVKNSPSNAWGRGLHPGRGNKMLHVEGQLSPQDKTTEPMHLS